MQPAYQESIETMSTSAERCLDVFDLHVDQWGKALADSSHVVQGQLKGLAQLIGSELPSGKFFSVISWSRHAQKLIMMF